MKKYSIPEVCLVFFEEQDVLTASSGDAGMNWDSQNWTNENGDFS